MVEEDGSCVGVRRRARRNTKTSQVAASGWRAAQQAEASLSPERYQWWTFLRLRQQCNHDRASPKLSLPRAALPVVPHGDSVERGPRQDFQRRPARRYHFSIGRSDWLRSGGQLTPCFSSCLPAGRPAPLHDVCRAGPEMALGARLPVRLDNHGRTRPPGQVDKLPGGIANVDSPSAASPGLSSSRGRPVQPTRNTTCAPCRGGLRA